ncbi:hypothetical protein, partial [Parenemella sanctibonifatiensis]
MDDNQHDEQLPLTTDAAIDAEPAAEEETDETPVAVDEVEVDEVENEADEFEEEPVVTTPPAPQFSASETTASSDAAAAQPPRRRAASRPAGPPQIPATVFAVGEPVTAAAPQTRTGTAAPVSYTHLTLPTNRAQERQTLDVS